MLNKQKKNVVYALITTALFVAIMVGGCTPKSCDGPPVGASDAIAPVELSPEELKDTAAVINGKKISNVELENTLDIFVSRISMFQPGNGANPDDLKNQMRSKVLDQMIDEELIFQASSAYAKDADVKVEEELTRIRGLYETEEAFQKELTDNKMNLDELKTRLLRKTSIQSYIDAEIMSKIVIPEEDIKKEYDNNKTEVKASHILCKIEAGTPQEDKDAALAKIKDAQKRIQNGESFEDIAKEISDCPSGQKGGDLGFFSKGHMVPEFEKAAFGATVDQMTDVVETQFGYHLIKVTERRDNPAVGSYEEAKPGIETQIKKQQLRTEIPNLLKELREKANILVVSEKKEQ